MIESAFQAFEAVGALVVVLDVDHRIVYWNRSCSNLTGYSFEDVRGREFWDYWVTKTGERRWIAWSNALSRDADGQVQYIIKTGIDRTESKRVENALRTSEAKLAGVIGIAADAIISIDSDRRIVIYNLAAEKIFGWSAAEVMGKPFDMLLPERFRDLRMGERMPEIFGLRKNGEEFPAQAAISKLDIDGNSLLTAVLRDVTEHEQRERERGFLAELGAVLVATIDYDEMLTGIARVVVQNLADCCAMGIVDARGNLQRMKVVHREPAKAALCERLRRIAIDRRRPQLVLSVLESKQPSLIAEVSSQYLESIAQSEAHLRALQELAPQSLMVVPLLAHGKLLGTVAFVSSSRHYGQEDLRLAEELAFPAALAIENARLYENERSHGDDLREVNQQMVRATIRAQELTEEAEAAQTRAEKGEHELREVAEFRETFIGIVGHDLRNPLAAIGLAAARLRAHGHLDGQDETAVARIVNSAQRMTRMISQLLDFTRARLGGGFSLEPKPIDLRAVFRSVVDEFAAPIQLEVEGDVIGTWDPDRLEEALSNILGNAVEHATPGTSVVVKAHADRGQVVLEISNQGSPIPADVLPFIFEPFRRGHAHERSATGNLGLGLYIANQIVLSHGGMLEAHSRSGTTTFVLRLPRHYAVDSPGRAIAPQASPHSSH